MDQKRRKDRLLELIGLLRDEQLHRAGDLARRLGVTLRTIYRDMDTLVASGVPVAGTRGKGYQMTAAVTLPPLNLTRAELEVLHLGVAVLSEASDPDLQTAARSLAAKIDATLPEDRISPATAWGLAVFPFADAAAGIAHIPAIRAAIRARRKLRLTYFDNAGRLEEMVIRPLKLDYWGRVWTCSGWSEKRKEFQVFRVDQIEKLVEMSATFVSEPAKTPDDFT